MSPEEPRAAGHRRPAPEARWPHWRHALQATVVAAVIASAAGIAVYMYEAVNRVRDRLPAQIVAQQREVATMVHDFADLVRVVEGASRLPEGQRASRLLAHLRASRERLAGIRRSYNFDNLVGASAMHALVNPALADMERWLTEGLYEHSPESDMVMGLVRLRATEAYAQVRGFFDDSNDRAAQLIGGESAQLAQLRDSLVIYLGVFAAFAVGVLALLIAQRNAQARLAVARGRLSDSIENLSEGFSLFDADDRLVVCNERYRQLYSASAHMMQPGMSFEGLIRATDAAGVILGMEGASGDFVRERLARRRSPGRPFELKMSDGRTIRVSEYRTAEGGWVGIHTDITDLIHTRERLEHLATHDLLTGLPNRSLFQDRLAQAIARAQRRDEAVAVLFLDLDRFKLVNDTYGHAGGDALLKAVAERMRACLRESDTVARLGGDEFGAIMEDFGDWSDLVTAAERTLAALREEFHVEGGGVSSTISIGVAVFPQDGVDIPTLMKNADAACYHAKALGRNNFQFYTGSMNARAAQRLELEHHLRHAIERGELTLHFQPLVQVCGGRVCALEALLRWHSAELGTVAPDVFIPVAEEIGLIGPLGEWVIEQACAQQRAWREQGLELVPVSVNISPRQLHMHDLAQVVEQALARHGLPADLLQLEITESGVMRNEEASSATLVALSAMGVRIAIDDFGVGHSSLAALKRLPVHALKIDRSFVTDIDSDAEDLEIVSAVIAMAHTVRLKVVAEGVETEAQLALLRERSCDVAQGYLLGRPAPAADTARLLSADKPACAAGA